MAASTRTRTARETAVTKVTTATTTGLPRLASVQRPRKRGVPKQQHTASCFCSIPRIMMHGDQPIMIPDDQERMKPDLLHEENSETTYPFS